MIFAKMVLSRRPSEIERVYCKRGFLRERVLWFYRETWALRLGFFSQPLDRKGRSDGLNNTGALSDVVSYVALLRVNIMAAALAHSYMQLLYYPRRFLSISPPPTKLCTLDWILRGHKKTLYILKKNYQLYLSVYY